MLEEAADEFHGVQSDMPQPVAAFLAIREGDVSLFDSDDSGIGDRHAEDVWCKVFEGGPTVAYRLAVDVPGDIPDGGIYFME